MKVLKFDYNLINSFLFVILSMLFIIAINAIADGNSLLTKGVFLHLAKSNALILVLGFVTMTRVVGFKKFSEWFLLCFVILVVLKSFIFLYIGFSKIILALDFIYLLFGFYYFTTWELFVKQASNNPSFSENDLEKKSRFNIDGKAEGVNISFNFLLTNLDEQSGFLMITDSIEIKNIKPTTYHLTINYDGVPFSAPIEIVSSYDFGLGFIYKKEVNNLRSLSGFYKICLQRGIF
jgi:hypothetical protein